MMEEVLLVKARLDSNEARKMEDTLSKRFSTVAQRFGKGLQSVIKGSVLGISIGLLNKLLNPLEALEEKIRNLLGQGTDIADMADRFGATPGELKQLEDVSASMGVTPDQFKNLLTKYAEAVEKGREELANPFAQPSGTSIGLKNLVGEKDIAKSFMSFLNSLKITGQGPGGIVPLSEKAQRRMNEAATRGGFLSDHERKSLVGGGDIKYAGLSTRATELLAQSQKTGTPLTEETIKDLLTRRELTYAPVTEAGTKRLNEPSFRGVLSQEEIADLLKTGEARRQTGLEERQGIEKSVFGETQYGAGRRLVEANIPDQLKNIKEPGVDVLNQAINNLADLSLKQKALSIQGGTKDFVTASSKVNDKMITDMDAAEQLKVQRETSQLDSYADLKKAAIAVDKVVGLFQEGLFQVNKGVGLLGDVVNYISGLKNNRLFNMFSGGGKE